MRILKVTFLFLFITSIILEIINISFMNRIATDSIYIAKIKNEINSYDEQNLSLRADIMKYTSVAYLVGEAKQLGFSEAKEFISLSAPLLIASRQ